MSDERLNTVYLLLGSNIQAEENLPAAVWALSRCGTIAAVSRVWESPPVGYLDQPNFLNAAVKLRTPLSPSELWADVIARIERELHRVRDPENVHAPRTIDIDLVLFNRERLRSGNHRIPDPDLLTKAYMAVPLAEVDPDYVHPETGQTLAEIAATHEDEARTFRRRPGVDLAGPARGVSTDDV